MTNILALPLMTGSISIVANADWRQTIQFLIAGTTTPIDLTGVAFRSKVRVAEGNQGCVLDISSADGTFIVDAAAGKLSWAVPQIMLARLSGDYVTDIIAEAEGISVNLCAEPLALRIRRGVT